jgi:hypothetical protein
MRLSANFHDYEFWCKCGQCEHLLILHPGFIDSLQEVREDLALPMSPTSGCRCRAHNLRVGGHPRSLHISDFPAHADKGQEGTLGADFAAEDGNYRGRLFSVLWRHGFSIGWNAKKKFLHADRRDWIGMKQTSFDY